MTLCFQLIIFLAISNVCAEVLSAGCILQSPSIAFVEVVVLIEISYRNGFFTSEKGAKKYSYV